MARISKDKTSGTPLVLTEPRALSISIDEINPDDPIGAIKDAHAIVEAKGRELVIAAGKCGELLDIERAKLDEERIKKPATPKFTDWVVDNFPFSWRTAYNYIKVHETLVSSRVDISGCKSVREVLKLVASSDGKGSKTKDKAEESYVSHVMKIEQWFSRETELVPLKDWPLKRKEQLKRQLKNLVDIHTKVVAGS